MVDMSNIMNKLYMISSIATNLFKIINGYTKKIFFLSIHPARAYPRYYKERRRYRHECSYDYILKTLGLRKEHTYVGSGSSLFSDSGNPRSLGFEPLRRQTGRITMG